MNQHETVNYLEFPASNMPATKAFFMNVFAWSFEDYGDQYMAFSSPSIEGGFYGSEMRSDSSQGAALVVFYSEALEDTQQKVVEANGEIVQPIFSFPGGRRFHFKEPSGNEFAVWSDKP